MFIEGRWREMEGGGRGGMNTLVSIAPLPQIKPSAMRPSKGGYYSHAGASSTGTTSMCA